MVEGVEDTKRFSQLTGQFDTADTGRTLSDAQRAAIKAYNPDGVLMNNDITAEKAKNVLNALADGKDGIEVKALADGVQQLPARGHENYLTAEERQQAISEGLSKAPEMTGWDNTP